MFTVDASKLAPALALLSKVMPSRASAPALLTVRLDAAEGRLRLRATDLEIAGLVELEADVAAPISTCIPAAEVKLLAKIKQGRIRISCADGRLLIEDGRAQRVCPTSSPEDFPAEPAFEKIEWQALADYPTLRRMYSLTGFAVSAESVMYALTGVYLEPGKQALSMVATDGKRMALVARPMQIQTRARHPEGVIVPPRILKIMSAPPKGMAAAPSVVVSASTKDMLVCFDTGSFKLFSRLIEGRFPDYQNVIPHDRDRQLTVEVPRLTDALKSILPADSSVVRFELRPDEAARLECRSLDQEAHRASTELLCSYRSDAIDIQFDPDYLTDYLKAAAAAGAAVVDIWMRTANTACVLRSPQLDDYTYVLMPLSVAWAGAAPDSPPQAIAA